MHSAAVDFSVFLVFVELMVARLENQWVNQSNHYLQERHDYSFLLMFTTRFFVKIIVFFFNSVYSNKQRRFWFLSYLLLHWKWFRFPNDTLINYVLSIKSTFSLFYILFLINFAFVKVDAKNLKMKRIWEIHDVYQRDFVLLIVYMACKHKYLFSSNNVKFYTFAVSI